MVFVRNRRLRRFRASCLDVNLRLRATVEKPIESAPLVGRDGVAEGFVRVLPVAFANAGLRMNRRRFDRGDDKPHRAKGHDELVPSRKTA
jgi:hypothetical protein